MGNTGRWRVAILLLGDNLDPIGNQHLNGGGKGRLRERMGIFTDKQRACGPLLRANFSHSLSNRQNMLLVKGGFIGATPVA